MTRIKPFDPGCTHKHVTWHGGNLRGQGNCAWCKRPMFFGYKDGTHVWLVDEKLNEIAEYIFKTTGEIVIGRNFQCSWVKEKIYKRDKILLEGEAGHDPTETK